MKEELQLEPRRVAVGTTKKIFIENVFRVAETNGDKLSIKKTKLGMSVAWECGFGLLLTPEMESEEIMYEAARNYNITKGLKILEPSIL
jgi:hypothetical protein